VKHGAVFASIGITLSIIGLLFFDDHIVLKFSFLIVGLLLAVLAVFKKKEDSKKH